MPGLIEDIVFLLVVAVLALKLHPTTKHTVETRIQSHGQSKTCKEYVHAKYRMYTEYRKTHMK